MKWAKVASNIHTHPKVRKAGRDGRDVFIFLLLKNAELEADGVLDAQYIDPDYLADMLGVTHETACNGVKRSIVSSLIEVEEDVVRIIGWESSTFSAGVASSTERVRKHRERKRQSSDETLRNVSCNNGNAVTPKSRGEESRVDIGAQPTKRRASALPLPADWSPTEAHVQLAAELGVDVAREAASFRDHAEANDRRQASWPAAFRTWLRNAQRYAKRDLRPSERPPVYAEGREPEIR